ncbi:DUF3147 family protein [Candidatus Peregrinibacteria bacterium]|jgi:hypothetical protein|nr:DUF3147 family protein [Candidatus Peregrinibacteria bacterium]
MDPFILKLVLSFVVGSLWITGATVVAEKAGTKLGGFIAGLPSTIVVGLLFIGVVNGAVAAGEATDAMGLLVGIGCVMLVVFSWLVSRGFWLALAIYFSIWLVAALGSFVYDFHYFWAGCVVFLVLFFPSLYLLEKALKISSEEGRKIDYTRLQIFGRIVLSGSMITFAVYLSKVGGPLLGGIFSVFPAVILSTLIIAYLAHGVEFTRSISKALILSSPSLVLYAILVRWSYPEFGLFFGTAISYVVSVAFGWPCYQFMKKYLK